MTGLGAPQKMWPNSLNAKQDARGPAGYFPPQISSKKTTGQQICSLLTLFNIPIYEVCRKFDKNCIKNFENWKTLGFLSFSVSIWYIFHLENSHYLFGKAYWTTNSCHSCHVKRFQHSNPRSLSKIWQKLHKNVKNRKILEFFNILFGNFSFKKPHLSLQNTIGQRIRAFLNVFNILIHDVYRKNDKNCIKTLKVEKFWNFCHFFLVIFLLKNRIYLFRILLDNEFVPCWTFSTF